MSRFTFCNCPAGFNADPERHAPDCPGRSGAGKARTPVPATIKTAEQSQGEPVAWRYRTHTGGLWYLSSSEHNARMFENAEKGSSVEPLYTHADPGEVERLREVEDAYKALEGMVELAAKAVGDNTGLMWMKIQTAFLRDMPRLRAQLAERDALLRDLVSMNVPRTMSAIEKAKALLSASAEPSAPVERDGWVSVTERKPEYDKVVLVAFDNHEGKNYTTAHLTNQKRCADPRSTEHDEVWYVHVSGGHRLKTVTHWCEIDRASLECKP